MAAKKVFRFEFQEAYKEEVCQYLRENHVCRMQIYAGQLLFSPFLVLLCLHNVCFHVSQSRIFSEGNISKHILTLLSDNRPIPYMLLRMTAKALSIKTMLCICCLNYKYYLA